MQSYYRLIVKTAAGKFVFRTSKIATVTEMLSVRAALDNGFNMVGDTYSANYTVEVLSVLSDVQGKILTPDQIINLNNAALEAQSDEASAG